MGRPTKLTPEVANIIIQHIGECATYESAANAAGISYSTFRSWMVRGEQDGAWVEARPNALVLPEQLRFVEFSEAVTRAQAQALATAARSVHEGITGAVAREFTREKITEPARDKAGNIILDKDTQKPMMVERTLERETVKQKEPDWRAGIEFLKRRDTDNWTDKLIIEATLKQVPSEALSLLPELARLAEEAEMDLANIFAEMVSQFGQAKVAS